MANPYRMCSSYLTYDENYLWESSDISGMKFYQCEFVDLELDNIDITGTKFEDCVFKNIKVKNVLGQSMSEFAGCKFINCNVELASYISGIIRGCSFVFTDNLSAASA